jgi:hypothetical protein
MPIVESLHTQWEALRAAVIADDTAITTFDFDSWPASRAYSINGDYNQVAIAFWGKTDENAVANYKLFGRRRANGPIELVAAGVLTLGSRVVTKNPISKEAVTAKWVDTVTNTAEWVKAVTVRNSTNNGICYLTFDAFGLGDLYLEIDVDDATEINAIITGV